MNGGIRWLTLNGEIRGGEAVNGRGEYEWAKTFERGTFDFGDRENFWEIRRLYWSIFQGRDWENYISGFGLRNLLDCYRGASVAVIFGLGGQESLRNPGAREPDRLCS